MIFNDFLYFPYFLYFPISLFSLFLAFEYYRWSAAGRSPAARCSARRSRRAEGPKHDARAVGAQGVGLRRRRLPLKTCANDAPFYTCTNQQKDHWILSLK